MDRSRLKEEDEKLRESRLSGEAVFEGRLLHVYRDRVKLPDGRESTREYLRHPGAAAVVLLKEGKILLERQWRYPLGRVFWEVPAGKLEAGRIPRSVPRVSWRKRRGTPRTRGRRLARSVLGSGIRMK